MVAGRARLFRYYMAPISAIWLFLLMLLMEAAAMAEAKWPGPIQDWGLMVVSHCQKTLLGDDRGFTFLVSTSKNNPQKTCPPSSLSFIARARSPSCYFWPPGLRRSLEHRTNTSHAARTLGSPLGDPFGAFSSEPREVLAARGFDVGGGGN